MYSLITKLAIVGAAVVGVQAQHDMSMPDESSHSMPMPSESEHTSSTSDLSTSSSYESSQQSSSYDLPPSSLSVSITSAPSAPYPTSAPAGCPTVTETGTLCSTCVQNMCLQISTVTVGCDCPNKPETATLMIPCGTEEEDVCKDLGCPTSYEIVTATDCGTKPTGKPSVSDSGSGSEHTPGPSHEPSKSKPPAPTSSGPVKAGAGRTGLSVAGVMVAAGAFAILL